MQRDVPRLQLFLEMALPWVAVASIVIFTYAKFFQPYVGFDFNSFDGEIYEVYVHGAPGAELRPGDILVQVGSVSWEAFRADLHQTLFANTRPGQVVPIVVRRNGQLVNVSWVLPGHNLAELLQRLNSEWWLAWIFVAAGILTTLSLRPRDGRWRLLVAFNFVNALWLIAGSVSRWQTWDSALVLHSAVWLSVPIYLHLHWTFPEPLGRSPRGALAAIYLPAIVLAGAEWFQRLPRQLYESGFLLAMVGSLALLVLHLRRQPGRRRDVFLLFLAALVVLAVLVVVGVVLLLGSPPSLIGAAFLALPVLPATYLYTAYRHQMGPRELRVNRLFSAYLFLILIVLGVAVLLALWSAWFDLSGAAISLIVAALAVVATAFGFPRFQRLIEERVLGIPPAATRLAEKYAGRVATRPSEQQLIELLAGEVLPSLDVRQWVLLRCDQQHLTKLRAVGVPNGDLPRDEQLPALLSQAGTYRPSPAAAADVPCPWARLILPLRFGDTLVGLWLFGRRDPDDFYARVAIETLQALAAQTAVSLANLRQAEDLHLLSQANIERHEAERTSLARELHDEVLNQVGTLINAPDIRPGLVDGLHALAERLRRTISGLRPKVLDYSLRAALDHLADELKERKGNPASVTVEVEGGTARYPAQVEQHLYRIVQQAGENALKHAGASHIVIRGRLDDEAVELVVEDDGRGFETPAGGSLAEFAAQRRYGLTGMAERAALIAGKFDIESSPGRGTRVRVSWRPHSDGSPHAA